MPEKETSLFSPDSKIPRYPKDLVHRHGAKAGLLLHVAKYLPDIPQAKMVVSEPGESAASLLQRAAERGIGYPRLYRSSAVAELVGYEGDLTTIDLREVDEEYIKSREEGLIIKVRRSPQKLKAKGLGLELPDEIEAIVAEKSPSRYLGTYIKLPNADNSFLLSLTDMHSNDKSRDRDDYIYTIGEGFKKFTGLEAQLLSDEEARPLEAVVSWHDRIANLPDMDPSWAYQLEFGIDPPCLYQVRPFRPVEKASFRIENPYKYPSTVVIGITPPEGIIARVVHFPKRGWRDLAAVTTHGDPVLFNGQTETSEWANKLENVQIASLQHWRGLLAHGPIKLIRQIPLAILSHLNLFEEYDGQRVRVISDGINFKIEKISE